MSSEAADTPLPHTNKRKRLSAACDRCRQRKVRCDDAQPVCTNCLNSGAECVTKNPRQPDLPAERMQARGSRQKRFRRTTQAQKVDQADSEERSPGLPRQQSLERQDLVHSEVPDAEPSRNHDLSESRVTIETHAPSPVSTRNPPETSYVGPSVSRVNIESWTPEGPDTTSEVAESAAAEPLPSIPRITSGNSLTVLAQWLNLAFARLGVPDRFSGKCRKGDTHAALSPSTSEDLSQELRCNQLRQANAQKFLASTNLVFPLISPDDITRILTTSESPSSIEDLFYRLVLASGFSRCSIETIKYQSYVLDDTLSKLIQVTKDETIQSIKTLILMSLLSRAQDKSELAWQMLAMAVARALSISLDRRSTISERLNPQNHARINTWWSLFVLDKVLAVELLRPPMIRDCFHDQEMPWVDGMSIAHPSLHNCFLAIIDLAKIQEKVLEVLLRCTKAEASGRVTMYEAVNDKMRSSGELDQLLVTWAERLPFDLKPSEYPSCDAEILPAVSFLAMQYQNTMFLIHRNALIISPQAIKARIDEHFPQASWRHRVLKGAVLCGNIARSIVHILGKTQESNMGSILDSIYGPLISIYALAIVIIKSSATESARVDLEIQASAIRLLARIHPLMEEDSSTIHYMIKTLHSQLRKRVRDKTDKTSPPQMAFCHSQNPTENDRSDVVQPDSHMPLRASFGTEHCASLSTSYHSGQTPHCDNPIDISMTDEITLDFFDKGLDFDAIDLDAFALAFDLPS